MILKLNEPQNNLQLIQIGENYIVINLVTKLKENDYNYSMLSGDIGRLALIGVGEY